MYLFLKKSIQNRSIVENNILFTYLLTNCIYKRKKKVQQDEKVATLIFMYKREGKKQGLLFYKINKQISHSLQRFRNSEMIYLIVGNPSWYIGWLFDEDSLTDIVQVTWKEIYSDENTFMFCRNCFCYILYHTDHV